MTKTLITGIFVLTVFSIYLEFEIAELESDLKAIAQHQVAFNRVQMELNRALQDKVWPK